MMMMREHVSQQGVIHDEQLFIVLQVRRAIVGLDLPNNPLDELIDRLGGPAAVAEMTGRKGRLVRRRNGEAGVKWEARNASGVAAGSSLDMINVHERQLFLDGDKLVAIISEAASAGISLHADRCALLLLLPALLPLQHAPTQAAGQRKSNRERICA
jgi:hypothetical protein